MRTVGLGETTTSYPVIEGVVSKFGKSEKKFLQVKDSANNLLFSGEVVDKKGAFSSKNLQKVTVIDPETKQSKNLYLKINSIQTQNPVFSEFLKKNDVKKVKESFLQMVSTVQLEGVKKAPVLAKEAEVIKQKVEWLQKANIQVAESKGKGDEKVRINVSLDKPQIEELVKHIESNKESWLKEADEKGEWIKKEVKLSGGIKVTVEIFPKDREAVDKLGRIEIQMDFIAKGSFKKVFRSFSYETGRIKAGAYVKGDEYIKSETDSEAKVKEGLKEINAPKKRVVVSDATDIKTKSSGVKQVKLTQKLLNQMSLADVFEKGELPDGSKLTPRIKCQLMVSALDSLEQLHSMKLVHADIKPGNLLLKEKKSKEGEEKQYEVYIGDYGLVVEEGSTNSLKGTPGYIAPELLLDYKHQKDIIYNLAGDQYSLSLTFSGEIDPWWDWDAATYDGLINKEILEMAASGEEYMEEPSDKKSFEWGLWKMVNFDPNNRFSSATEARQFFESLTF